MSTPVKEREQVAATGEEGRNQIEARLTQLQQEDYVMPGWQLSWSEIDQCVMVLFQLCHLGMPEAMTEFEFRVWLRGWEQRQVAVIARRPRAEQVRTPLLP